MDNVWWIIPTLFLIWAMILVVRFPDPVDCVDFELLPMIQLGTIITLIFGAFCFILGHFI